MPATKGKKKSWFWNYSKEIYCRDNVQWFQLCLKCWNKKQFKAYKTTSTFHLKSHLKADHSITKISFQTNEFTVLSALCTADASDETLSEPLDDNIQIKQVTCFTFKTLKQQLIQQIIVMHITFSQVENDWFQAFLAVFNMKLAEWIPKSSDTV